jgi:catechol 2,3-dioxygenase-like lactoylglutathione lyase family enzyme
VTPLSFAAIGVHDLPKTLAFYRDLIGFDLLASGSAGTGVAAMLGLPQGTAIETALLAANGCKVGRILLLDIAAPGRKYIRQPGDRTSRGLWNLNFYVDDIRATGRHLAGLGYELWSDPVEYELGTEAGSAIELLFEGPDGVAINLVQPLGDLSVFTGRIRAEAARAGRTETGFTPVATTANCVYSMERSCTFYETLLGGTRVLDEVLGRPETNHFLCRPADARSHTVFLGTNLFGKLSLNAPLNYAVAERGADAVPPNIGYFAQGFVLTDLATATARAVAAGGVPFGVAAAMTLPGFDGKRAGLVRSPDEGALAWLVESE